MDMDMDMAKQPTRLKAIACAIIAIGLGFTATTNAISNVFAKKNPPLAYQFGWKTGPALGEYAELRMKLGVMAKNPDKGVEPLALAALRKEAITPPALNVLALAAADRGEIERAYSLFAQSDLQSRRNIVAEVWLIEYLLRKDRVVDAIGKFDVAMRVSVEGQKALLPVLAMALREDKIFGQTKDVFRKKPVWLPALVETAIALPDTQPNVARAVVIAGGLAGQQDAGGLSQNLFTGLVTQKQYDVARQLYRTQVKGDQGALTSIGFTHSTISGSYAPIAWELKQNEKVQTEWELSRTGKTILSVTAGNGANGPVARKLVFLEPGRYSLTIQAGKDDAYPMVPLDIALRCGHAQSPLMQMAVTKQGPARNEGDVLVPPDCNALIADITVRGVAEGTTSRTYLNSIELKKL